MTEWTPSRILRAKVIGLVWRDDRFLAAEVTTSDNRIKGVRPLGGSIEFGETREEALSREFREELGSAIQIRSGWHAFENLFYHEGAPGHEYIFASRIDLVERSLYAQDRITFKEADGADEQAAWFRLSDLDEKGLALYPTGLRQALDEDNADLPRHSASHRNSLREIVNHPKDVSPGHARLRPSSRSLNLGPAALRGISNVRLVVNPFPGPDSLRVLWQAAWGAVPQADMATVLQHSLFHLGAFADQYLVGFVNVATDGGKHAFILDTCVHPDFQRRGIGKEMILHAINLARRGGSHWLHVDYEPRHAAFYRACGFQPTEAGLIAL